MIREQLASYKNMSVTQIIEVTVKLYQCLIV